MPSDSPSSTMRSMESFDTWVMYELYVARNPGIKASSGHLIVYLTSTNCVWLRNNSTKPEKDPIDHDSQERQESTLKRAVERMRNTS